MPPSAAAMHTSMAVLIIFMALARHVQGQQALGCWMDDCDPKPMQCSDHWIFWEKCQADNVCADGLICAHNTTDDTMKCRDYYSHENGFENCYETHKSGCVCDFDCCNPKAVCYYSDTSQSSGTCRLPCEGSQYTGHCPASTGTPLESAFYSTGIVHGQYQILDSSGNPIVLKGVSFTGLEHLNAGSWLFQSGVGTAEQLQASAYNLIVALKEKWNIQILRVPICLSAWEQDYKIFALSDRLFYRDYLDTFVNTCVDLGIPIIIDGHTWAVEANQCSSTGWQEGCYWGDCAPYDYYTDRNKTCTYKSWGIKSMCWYGSGQPTIHSAYKNRVAIANTWKNIAARYANTGNVFLELFNEPYSFNCKNTWIGDTDWDSWASFYYLVIKTIRDAGYKHILIVAGYDYGYDYYSSSGPLAVSDPSTLMPWVGKYSGIAYAFHPYQHGACCGKIASLNADGTWTDLSASDPYENHFCTFQSGCVNTAVYFNSVGASNSRLPVNGGVQKCTSNGLVFSIDAKMPPCTKVPSELQICGLGPCAGARDTCPYVTHCPGVNDSLSTLRSLWNSTSMGGWSKYALPINQFGPLIASEFGTYDCSSPFIKNLMRFNAAFNISYTAWAIQPQNTGGSSNGACSFPSLIQPTAFSAEAGNFHACSSLEGCKALLEPLQGLGQIIYDDIQGTLKV